MPVSITIDEVNRVGPALRFSDHVPTWGIIFQINREDGIGTAIGVTVRCEDQEEAKQQAIVKLQSFLSEAAETAENFLSE